MRKALLATLAALVLLAPGVAGTQEDPTSAIGKMLEERGAALKAGDRNRFLASVDSASSDFRKAQEELFDRVRSVPVAEYSLKLDEDAPLFTRKRDRDAHGKDAIVAAAEERIQIADFDAHPALGRLIFTFVMREGKWVIASDSALDDLGVFTTRHPWEFGPIEVRKSEHFLMILHGADSPFAEELLALAEQALPNVDRVWKHPWQKKVVIYVPASKKELEKIIDATFDVDPFVAFAAASVDRDTGWLSTSPRIILNRGNFLRHTPVVRRAIFAHELLHVATREASGPFVLAFVEEGLAQTAESERAPAFGRAFRGVDTSVRLPEDVEFITGGPRSIGLTYNKAHSAVAYMQERFGINNVNRFYLRYGSARTEPGGARYHLDLAIAEVYGISLMEFESSWANYVTSG